jgi:hypothetical protein
MRDPHPGDRPAIPLIDLGAGGVLALLEREMARARALLDVARRRHTRPVLRLADRLSHSWLERADNPYRHEIRAIARAVGAPGAVMLNLSFEWTCTSGAASDARFDGSRLLRVLDWPLDGLGRYVVVARHATPAGEFYNVTWPGAVGVLTAMAPGRFSAAINQAPMVRHGLTLVGDWARNRLALWRSRELPPAHLLRQVFEIAPDYATAQRLLAKTPVVLPALFVLSGVRADQSCVIERLATQAFVHEGVAACANDWLSPGLHGRARGQDNKARCRRLADALTRPDWDFAWLEPPLLNRRTRLAVAANAAASRLSVIGIERGRPATREFSLHS